MIVPSLPLLFNTVMEVLAKVIKQEKEIQTSKLERQTENHQSIYDMTSYTPKITYILQKEIKE